MAARRSPFTPPTPLRHALRPTGGTLARPREAATHCYERNNKAPECHAVAMCRRQLLPRDHNGQENSMGTHTKHRYVLIAGAFHGGWAWRSIAERLRAAGHEV